MAAKPAIMCNLRPGLAIGAARGFAACFNWLLAWVWNIAAGPGIAWQYRDSDHPVLRANLRPGSGISITESGNALVISLSESESESSPSPRRGGGGYGGAYGGGVWPWNSATGGGGYGGGAYGGGGWLWNPATGGGSWGTDSGGTAASCNTWSGDPDNDNVDSGLSNPEDDCNVLNGW